MSGGVYDLSIRRASVDDAAGISAIVQHRLPHLRYGTRVQLDAWFERFYAPPEVARRIVSPHCRTLVCEREGRPVGTGSLSLAAHSISGVYTAMDGVGAGSAVLGELVTIADEFNLPVVTMSVLHADSRMLFLAAKLGFVVAREDLDRSHFPHSRFLILARHQTARGGAGKKARRLLAA